MSRDVTFCDNEGTALQYLPLHPKKIESYPVVLEVSAERVRNKIAASRAKGLLMGGTPPLGYDLKDKQLVPNPQERELVNLIFTSIWSWKIC